MATTVDDTAVLAAIAELADQLKGDAMAQSQAATNFENRVMPVLADLTAAVTDLRARLTAGETPSPEDVAMLGRVATAFEALRTLTTAPIPPTP